jgi:hypothetical protein
VAKRREKFAAEFVFVKGAVAAGTPKGESVDRGWPRGRSSAATRPAVGVQLLAPAEWRTVRQSPRPPHALAGSPAGRLARRASLAGFPTAGNQRHNAEPILLARAHTELSFDAQKPRLD